MPTFDLGTMLGDHQAFLQRSSHAWSWAAPLTEEHTGEKQMNFVPITLNLSLFQPHTLLSTQVPDSYSTQT